MFSLWVVAVVGLASAQPTSASATTSVTCTTDEWAFNEDNLSPCLVASALEAACNGGTWNIPPLAPNSQYVGPYQGQSNKCVCSTVVYSLVSACGACQGGGITTWSHWSFNCTASDITLSQYPHNIPPAISIPSWAYLSVITADVWDPSAALAAHNSGAPDSTVATSATATSATATSASTGIPSSTGTPTKNSNHAAAIAGGVVGGVVGLALISIGVFVLIRQFNKAPPVSSGGREMFDLAASPAPFHGIASPPLSMQAEPQRFYDPSDPSTFPSSPCPTFPAYAPSTTASDSAATSYHPHSPQPVLTHGIPSGRYTGVPEV